MDTIEVPAVEMVKVRLCIPSCKRDGKRLEYEKELPLTEVLQPGGNFIIGVLNTDMAGFPGGCPVYGKVSNLVTLPDNTMEVRGCVASDAPPPSDGQPRISFQIVYDNKRIRRTALQVIYLNDWKKVKMPAG